MIRPEVPPVAPGDVIRIEEPDYLHGVGPGVLEITAVGVIERLIDGWWLNLRGIALRPDGSRRSSCERYVLVRLEALRRQVPGNGGHGR